MTWKGLFVAVLLIGAPAAAEPPVVVASKSFTESVLLGEIIRLRLEAAGIEATHRRALGGTRILYAALQRGDIDLYPEYSGTLRHEIFAGDAVADRVQIAARLMQDGIVPGPALGFDNAYALATRPALARERGLRRISDLIAHPDLRFGFSNEFMDRADGWRALKAAYGLPQRADGLAHDLAYRGIATRRLDVIDVYTTDAEIAYYHLRLLDDDRGFFPDYSALILSREELAERRPEVHEALHSLGGRIDAAEMRAMNKAVKIDGVPDSRVAAGFLRREIGISLQDTPSSGLYERLERRISEHLILVALSLAAAILLAVPLGVVAAQRPRPGAAILALVGLLQTIPALALFVFLIPALGIGTAPTLAALFLYSLLPIVRASHSGLAGIPAELKEAAEVIGLSARTRLLRVELPLALPAILSGVKTAAVINVGLATLGALIGAGGLGQPILTGIRLDDIGLILEGAIPAAALALVVTGIFDRLERWLTPRGLRLPPRD